MEVDVASLEQLLVRIAPLIAPADLALIEKLVGTLVGLVRQIRECGTTIARLRRLVGMAGTEKTRAVLGRPRDGGTPRPEGASPAAPDGQGGARPGEASPPTTPAPKPATPAEAKRAAPHKGHGRLGCSAYPHACHTRVAHESLRPGDRCPLCGRSVLIELDPAHWLRIVGRPALAAECSCLQRLRCCVCGAVFTAKAPPEAQGAKMTPSAVAMVAELHYRGGMPHHRLEQIQENLETPLPASTQSEAVAAGAEDLRPLHQELKKQAAQGDVIYLDDTRGPVLEFMGKRRAAKIEAGELPNPERSGLFTTGLVCMDARERKIALFMTGRKHAGENLTELLSLRPAGLPKPVIMSDALASNAPEGHAFIESHCIPHGRRHFVDEMTNRPQECAYVLERLEVVFKVEALSRQYRLGPQQRLRLHQRQSAPVMDQLQAWMREQFAEKRVEPNSGLGRAINYMLKRWMTFTVFLRVPGAPLDNNTAERALKTAIRHRRNSLFYRSLSGAAVGDCYMSLLYTAELNGENPLAYLTTVLSHPAAVQRSPQDWLPWNYRATLARMGEGGRSGAAAPPGTAATEPAAA